MEVSTFVPERGPQSSRLITSSGGGGNTDFSNATCTQEWFIFRSLTTFIRDAVCITVVAQTFDDVTLVGISAQITICEGRTKIGFTGFIY